MKYFIFLGLCTLISFQSLTAQGSYFRSETFTEKDSLRGTLSKERACFDVTHYDLTVQIDTINQSIKGENVITFELLEKSDFIQLDLFANMSITSIFHRGKKLDFYRKFDAFFVKIADFEANKPYSIAVKYQGKPKVALTPPWDGGFQWSTDDNGDPWIHVTCQGIGASLWWPNKDHLSDEPDSMAIKIGVPKAYMAISNGNLQTVFETAQEDIYSWKVQYPINNYNVTFSVGRYEHFSSEYKSPLKDKLKCDYYVMPYNLEKAKIHFKQVNSVLEAFEHYFGPYPFWDDGYALIETPHLGMEHQSAIAYGNKFQRGYLGGMIPEKMNWDYIIVHETGHEYWGNAVTANDYAELWIHESFTTYMEALYVEYHLGYDESIAYLVSQNNHANSYPIVGPKNVNYHKFKNSDHYFKGSWMLHTLRHTINDDDKFFSILKKFYEMHKYGNANSEDFFKLVNKETGIDYGSFFQQYLFTPEIPILAYKLKQKGKHLIVQYKWNTPVKDFNMRIKLGSNESQQFVTPVTDDWKKIKLENTKEADFKVSNDLFLIDLLRIKGS